MPCRRRALRPGGPRGPARPPPPRPPATPPPPPPPARRALRARMAAHHLHAGIPDAAAHTAPARAAFLARFEREVDPDGVLDPRERARRAGHARKAYFLRLALASAHARGARRANGRPGPTAER